MNDFLRDFILTAVFGMIRAGKAQYQVYTYAVGWFDKGILTEDDLRAIAEAYVEPESEDDGAEE